MSWWNISSTDLQGVLTSREKFQTKIYQDRKAVGWAGPYRSMASFLYDVRRVTYYSSTLNDVEKSRERSLIYRDRNRRVDSMRKVADAILRRSTFEQSINRASNAARSKRKAICILFSASFRCWQLSETSFRANSRFLPFYRRKWIENNVAVRRFIVVLAINHRLRRFNVILTRINRNNGP